MDIQIVFHSTTSPNGVDKALAEPGGLGAWVRGSKTTAVKFVLVSFGLDFVLLRESSILDPSHEIWE
jgi:hypothetical protein